MSKYTTEVRFICEQKSGLSESVGFTDVDKVISESWDKIITTNVKFFDDSYKPVLCKKILKHYYLREIGCETVGVWMLWLNTRLEEIIPYYNKLYESELIKFNPLYNTDLTRTHNKKNEGTNEESTTGSRNLTGKRDTTRNTTMDITKKGDGSTTDDGRTTGLEYNLYSETPQGGLSGVDSETYLTDARKINNSGTSHNDGSNQYSEKENDIGKETVGETWSENEGTTGDKSGAMASTEDYLEHIIGKDSGESFSEMLMKYRDTFLNIDMMVINEFSDLFMMLW